MAATALSVIVVDDDLARRDYARSLLELACLDVVGVVGSCAEALEQVDRLSPDGVLAQVRLPDGTGHELARTWLCGASRAPVVVLTSVEASRLDRVSLASVGVRSHVRLEDLHAADLGALFAP
jgi:CheY-like chemotaxis protein